MLVLLVRHGHAGTKRNWDGHDRLRPLDAIGLAQSEGLPAMLAPFTPTRILSSPFVRCLQSVAPVADAFGIRLERSSALLPDAGPAAMSLALEASTPSGSVVLCTHGEVIHDLQTLLGLVGAPAFNPAGPREKGSVWVLERVDGRFVRGTYLSPHAGAEAMEKGMGSGGEGTGN